MSPRYVLAEMMHETNTFSPQLTDIERFGRNSPDGGLLDEAEAIELFGQTSTSFGGFYELLGDPCIPWTGIRR